MLIPVDTYSSSVLSKFQVAIQVTIANEYFDVLNKFHYFSSTKFTMSTNGVLGTLLITCITLTVSTD